MPKVLVIMFNLYSKIFRFWWLTTSCFS